MMKLHVIVLATGAVVMFVIGLTLLSRFVGRADSVPADPTEHFAMRWGSVAVGPVPRLGEARISLQPARFDGDPNLLIVHFDDGSEEPPQLAVNADTGEVLIDTLTPKQPDLADAILKTVITDLPPTDLWPFTDDEATTELKTYGSIAYLAPRSDSGVFVIPSLGYCVTENCSPHGITLLSSRSILHINADIGTVNSSDVDPNDADAFARFVQSIKLIPAAQPESE